MDRNVKQLEYVSPEIKYKNGPMDTFVHVDFIHRWFGVIDTKKMVKYGAHANVVFGTDKRQYTFREGWLIGFRRIPESEARVIVQNEKSDTWVLRRDWVKVFEKMTPQKAADFKISSYKDVLDEMAEYFMDGDEFKTATFLCKIEETNKV